jgi:uncharacterized membrane protein
MPDSILSKPEFYDIFGLPTFIFIFATSLWAVWGSHALPSWANYVLLVIGVCGIIIDGTIVYKKFITKI